ncbi:MAG: protein translocase subunit SecF [Ruminococcus sp.]|nr:protein translocase subunit SecF [Ruminococcus sp.]
MNKKIKKPVFFIVFILIAIFSCSVYFGFQTWFGDISTTYIKSISDIRLGIDIQGGVDVAFTPADGVDATDEQLDAVMETMKVRLTSLGINDSETYVDYNNDRVIVRFPWQSGETDFDPESAVEELGETAMLRFIEGTEYDESLVILEGEDVVEAYAASIANETTGGRDYVVSLEFSEDGATKFADATEELYSESGYISIWMDDTCVSSATVSAHITDGKAIIQGDFDYEEAKSLADKINSGALPFNLETASFKTISPTLGTGALNAMVLSCAIAFIAIAIYMIILYRLPGVVAVIALIGQLAGTLAVVSGYFSFMPSKTLTIPGIAGIILSVGMGVDANIITCERIKEELAKGKSIDTALRNGYARAFSAVLDGNLTQIIISIVLMGAFGVPDSFFAKMLNFVFFAFGTSTDSTIYSFGLTLLTGVIFNLFMGVFCTRLMIVSLSKFKALRKKSLYTAKFKEPKKKDYLSKKKIFITISCVLVAISLVVAPFFAKIAIEFKGGTMISYTYTGELNADDVKAKVEEIAGSSVTIQTGEVFGDEENRNSITISFVSNEGLTSDKQSEITNAVQETFPDNNIEILDSNDVSPSSGKSFLMKCVMTVIFSSILLILYIAIRFKKIGGLSAGVCAIIKLLHDVIITFGAFVLLGYEINANFMAVVLTILGYSINDTIVIYDRIRENRTLMPNESLNNIVNLSISQSMRRSIRTSITTIFAMITVSVVCTISGITSILSFSIPLAIGLTVGTYSSLFFNTPIWTSWNERKTKTVKDGKNKA